MVAPALIAAGASVLGGLTGGKGAKKAAQIQADAYQHGVDVQNQQFQQTRQDNMPFLQTGYGALDQTKGLLGLNGGEQQQSLYDMIKASPGFQSLYGTGQDTVLQNAAATGGVRGGNVNNELAQFGSGLFAQQIQQQLSNLGGLISTGSGTALNLGSLGQQNANSVADLIGKQGGANAVSAVSPYAAFQGILNQIGGDARTAMAQQGGWLSGIGNDPLGVGSIFGGVNAGKNMPGGGVINNYRAW